MWASCRNSDGFTLLELMVVLGLISLVTAVAVPGLTRLYDSVNRAIELDAIVVEINRLGSEAFETGQAFRLVNNGIDLPDGWQLVTDAPVRYSSRGFCSGGTLTLVKDGELQLRQRLTAPYCQVDHES